MAALLMRGMGGFGLLNAEDGVAQLRELGSRQWLGQHVGQLLGRGCPDQLDQALLPDLTDEVVAHVDVLAPTAIVVLLDHANGRLIVHAEWDRLSRPVAELSQQVADADEFAAALTGGDVLCLSAAQGDNRLPLGAPVEGCCDDPVSSFLSYLMFSLTPFLFCSSPFVLAPSRDSDAESSRHPARSVSPRWPLAAGPCLGSALFVLVRYRRSASPSALLAALVSGCQRDAFTPLTLRSRALPKACSLSF